MRSCFRVCVTTSSRGAWQSVPGAAGIAGSRWGCQRECRTRLQVSLLTVLSAELNVASCWQALGLLHSIGHESLEATFFAASGPAGLRPLKLSVLGLRLSLISGAAAEANVFSFTATSSAAEKAGLGPLCTFLKHSTGTARGAAVADCWRTAVRHGLLSCKGEDLCTFIPLACLHVQARLSKCSAQRAGIPWVIRLHLNYYVLIMVWIPDSQMHQMIATRKETFWLSLRYPFNELQSSQLSSDGLTTHLETLKET